MLLSGRNASVRLINAALINLGLPAALRELKPFQRRTLLTLAIETSCDDTCVAILQKSSHLDQHFHHHSDTIRGSPPIPHVACLHFNEKITLRNSGHGGIHPLEALDSHRRNLAQLVSQSLDFLPRVASGANIHNTLRSPDGSLRQKPDFITVTRGPGMRTNLSCGLDTAKGLAVAWQVPLIGAHHMQAHALTPRLVHAIEQAPPHLHAPTVIPRPDFPFLTLLVSGGHTMLVHSTHLTDHEILATTANVAIGDCLDKCGRLLLPNDVKNHALDTAFGKYLSQYAFASSDEFVAWPAPATRHEEIDKPLNEFGWQVQSPLSKTRDLTFSFSSISTTMDELFRTRTDACGGNISSNERRLMARTAVGTAFEHLGSRVVIALQSLEKNDIHVPTLVVSGGVAANDFLRHFLRALLDVRGFGHIELIFPPVELCTDNAAMIAWCGMEMFEAGFASELTIGSLKKWSMDATGSDGGILGVEGWVECNLDK